MTVRAYKLGALGQTDLTNVKQLMCGFSGATQWSSLQTPSGTAYQVTTTSNFYITKVCTQGSANSPAAIFGYGDTSAGQSNSTAPTGAVYLTAPIGNQTVFYESDIIVKIPAQKYPFCLSFANAGNVTVFGIEVPD